MPWVLYSCLIFSKQNHLKISINGNVREAFWCDIVCYFDQYRYNEVRVNAGPDCAIVLVGNKVDQRHMRTVSFDAAKRYADDRNIS